MLKKLKDIFQAFHNNYKTEKIRRKFEEQLPDGLDLISNSMRAGLTFVQAINILTEEMQEPLSSEFKEVLREHKFGVNFDESLLKMNDRIKSPDLDIFITAVSITRQTGGNTAEILNRISGTIRERQRLKNQIKVLTAQGKMSGIIVGCLPVALVIMLSFVDPSLIAPMFNTLIGISLVVLAIIMELLGALVIKKIITIDI